MKNSKIFTVIFIICLLLWILGNFLHGKFWIISTTMVWGIWLSLLFILWNKILWKFKFCKIWALWELLGLYDYPDLNWEWIVILRSSYNKDKQVKWKFTFTQTYSWIDGRANFDKTEWKFLFSKLIEKNWESGGRTWILIIWYENKWRVLDNLLPHKGYIHLESWENQDSLTWEYTTDGNRKTFWEITLKRVKK